MKTIFFTIFLVTITYAQENNSILDSLFYAKKNSVKTLNPEIGISIGIISNNKISYYSYGNLNRETNVKINKNTNFEIGSITKVFTSLLVADEISKNNIKADDFIEKYLPNHSLNKNLEHKIKIKNLVSYTSGLPTFHGDYYDEEMNKIDSIQPYKVVTKNQLISILSKTDSLKNQEYEYSNYNFALLGMILNNIENQPYSDLISKRILSQLKMNHTYCNYKTNENTAGYYDDNGKKVEKIYLGTFEAAGIIQSNAVDLTKFIHQQLYKKCRALYKATKISQQILYENSELKIAYSWHIIKLKENDVYLMQGDTFGNSSIIGFDTKNKIGIVILANQQKHDFLALLFDYIYKQLINK